MLIVEDRRLFRVAGKDLVEIDLQEILPSDAFFRGVAFSSPSDAWAFGGVGGRPDSHPFLLRSTDTGATWSDISPLLDRGRNRVVQSILWSDAMHGWASVPQGFTFGPPSKEIPPDYVMVTDDGGESWTPAGDCPMIELCRGQAECVFDDRTVPLGPAPGAEAFCASELPPHTRAHDLRASGEGVACDNTVCSYTTDSGKRWQESPSRPLTIGGLSGITGVVLTDAGGLATVLTLDDGSFFLRSDDCGETWDRDRVDFTAGAAKGIARNSAPPAMLRNPG